MKLATDTAALNYPALREQNSVHNAGYEQRELARLRAFYAILYGRYNDSLAIDTAGYEVSITLTSLSGSLTLTQDEASLAFDITALYDTWSKKMDALKDQIVDMVEQQQKEGGKETPGYEGFNDPEAHQALALCLPQQPHVALTMPSVPQSPTAPAKAA